MDTNEKQNIGLGGTLVKELPIFFWGILIFAIFNIIVQSIEFENYKGVLLVSNCAIIGMTARQIYRYYKKKQD